MLGIFEREKPQRSIIFLNTKKDLDHLSLVLANNGYPNLAISGDIVQKRREQIIADFQAGKTNILLATDIAARGLHIPDISHIFNYDLPQTAEDYVHRIGRTARAGASGKAISFACEEYVYSLPEIEHYIGTKIPVESIDDELLADVIPLSEAELNSLKHNYNNTNEHNPHYPNYANANNRSHSFYQNREKFKGAYNRFNIGFRRRLNRFNGRNGNKK